MLRWHMLKVALMKRCMLKCISFVVIADQIAFLMNKSAMDELFEVIYTF